MWAGTKKTHCSVIFGQCVSFHTDSNYLTAAE